MGRMTTRSLTDEEYKDIIHTIRYGYMHNGIEHRPNEQVATILVLEANLGCRIGDIIKLRTDSILKDGAYWKLNIIEEKTGKRRTFIVPAEIKKYIDNYATKYDRHGDLFTISCPAVWKAIRQVCEYLELENVSTHSFRKTCACRIYENTNHDIEAVCEFLQHSDIKVTRHYIKRSDAQLENAISKSVLLA